MILDRRTHMKKIFFFFVILCSLCVFVRVSAENVPTKGCVNAKSGLNVRVGPSEYSEIVTALTNGTNITIESVSGKWYKISSPSSGYVYSDYVTVTEYNEVEDTEKTDDSKLPPEEQEKVGCDIDRSLKNFELEKNPIK